ncbi:MKL/myocardin-like protein 2 [Clonorchis sinensis]|uniref:MKL/myocardin-like protein 2 n=1 Tax=Clonorchis sinensis TaxID=79923 RepID=H2KVN3_CLOSI|nr:MKL/myocardin-like protein 2 [Clonorchis sinensis]
MCAESGFRKSGSPRASTEVTSLQQNKLQNKEALEKGLRCRRSIKELVNQGILLSPSISHPDKVRQLQRAKTSDLLKHKIEKRPDRQQLINRRIIRDDKPGTSPYILEQCHNLEKYQLKTALNSKLTARPGTLELVEKGVLQVDPGVDSLIRCGSIPYPRVQNVSSGESVSTDAVVIPAPPPLLCIKPAPSAHTSKSTVPSRNKSSSRSSVGPSSTSRSIKDETVVYKLGSLVFHNYCPKSVQSLSPNLVTSTSFQQKQKAREAQQVEMLRLQDTARVHRLVEQELSQRAALRHAPSINQSSSPVESNTRGFGDISSSSQSPSVITVSPLNSPMSLGAVSTTENTHSGCVQNFITPDTNVQSPITLSPSGSQFINLASELGQAHTLDQLNVLQLRSECRERKLTASGSKSTLIRQLEPYRDQILASYFLNKDLKPVKYSNFIPFDPQSSVVQLQPPTAHQLPLLQPKPLTMTAPIWRMSTAGSGQHMSPFTSTDSGPSPFIPVQNSFVFCSSSPTSQQSAPSQSVDPSISTLTSATGEVLNVGLSLRHSSSAPHMVDITCPQQAESSADKVLIVWFFFHPLNTVSQAVVMRTIARNPRRFDGIKMVTPGAVNVFQTTQNDFNGSAGSCFHSPVSSSDQSRRSSNVVQGSVSESQQFLVTNMVDPYAQVNSYVRSDCPLNIKHPVHNSEPPTLVQIEHIWLRVRQLRRRIAKEQALDIQSDVKQEETEERSGRLQALMQEHEQLAVLCRLLVIERIDALDEMIDSGFQNGAADPGSDVARTRKCEWIENRHLPDKSNCRRLQETVTRLEGNYSATFKEPMEPPPSPLTTDALFELWDSVLKDTNKTNEDSSSEPILDSGLPHDLPSNAESMDVQTTGPTGSTGTTVNTLPEVRTLLSHKPDTFCAESSMCIPELASHPSPSNNSAHAQTPHIMQCEDHPHSGASLVTCFSEQLDFSTLGSSVMTSTVPTVCTVSSVMLPASTLWSSPFNSKIPGSSTFSCSAVTHTSGHRPDKSVFPGSSLISQVSVPPVELADALFTSLDSTDLAELMDTAEPVGMSPIAMNWTIDT